MTDTAESAEPRHGPDFTDPGGAPACTCGEVFASWGVWHVHATWAQPSVIPPEMSAR